MAQEPGRTYRLGIVSAGTRNIPSYVAMTEELRRLGFIEGKNLTIDFRSYGLRSGLMPEFVKELVAGRYCARDPSGTRRQGDRIKEQAGA
jgi:hypothetical protein